MNAFIAARHRLGGWRGRGEKLQQLIKANSLPASILLKLNLILKFHLLK